MPCLAGPAAAPNRSAEGRERVRPVETAAAESTAPSAPERPDNLAVPMARGTRTAAMPQVLAAMSRRGAHAHRNSHHTGPSPNRRSNRGSHRRAGGQTRTSRPLGAPSGAHRRSANRRPPMSGPAVCQRAACRLTAAAILRASGSTPEAILGVLGSDERKRPLRGAGGAQSGREARPSGASNAGGAA